MKSKILFFSFLVMIFPQYLIADDTLLDKNRSYSGAEAYKDIYKVIYQLDSNHTDIIRKSIRNIKNLINDPRLRGKVQVELISFAGGTEAMLKTSEYGDALKELISQGVIVAQCENTLKERRLDKSQFYDFLGYVPTANGELVIRASEGWVIIKP